MADLDTGDSGGHGKKRGGMRSKKMSTRIDMTPLVDLGFLLVTFFMMTTTFNKPNAMEVVMPDKKVEKEDDQTKVRLSEAFTVIIAQRNRVFYYKGLSESPDVQQTNYSANGLRKQLVDFNAQVRAQQRAEGRPETGPVILIKAIDESEFGHMVEVLDEMKITGIERYAIVDITPEERDMLPPL